MQEARKRRDLCTQGNSTRPFHFITSAYYISLQSHQLLFEYKWHRQTTEMYQRACSDFNGCGECIQVIYTSTKTPDAKIVQKCFLSVMLHHKEWKMSVIWVTAYRAVCSSFTNFKSTIRLQFKLEKKGF